MSRRHPVAFGLPAGLLVVAAAVAMVESLVADASRAPGEVRCLPRNIRVQATASGTEGQVIGEIRFRNVDGSCRHPARPDVRLLWRNRALPVTERPGAFSLASGEHPVRVLAARGQVTARFDWENWCPSGAWTHVRVLSGMRVGFTPGYLVRAAFRGSVVARCDFNSHPSILSVGRFVAVAAPGRAPSCRAEQIRASIRDVVPLTGLHPLLVQFRNRGAVACGMSGYPTVSLLTDRGRALPFAIHSSGDQLVTAVRPKPVVVRPGRSAWVLLDKYRCDTGDRNTATGLRLRLPGSASFVHVRIPGYFDIGYCGKGDPGSSVDVSPVEPSSRATIRP